MTNLYWKLPQRAQRRVFRVTGAFVLVSVALSVILTNVIMEVFSAGVNVPGLVVSIALPLAVGGPMTWFLVLKHEQLRHANAQLESLASTDWLTACLNRRAFTAGANRRLDRRNPGDRGGALLIADADDFKSINDRFGHDAGDEALRLIASAIRDAVRSTDLVGRLGGEEFGIFLTDADPDLADATAERIRSAVSDIAFASGGISCTLSVSIGGATFGASPAYADLYRLADQHLYQAKHKGRDCVAMMQAA